MQSGLWGWTGKDEPSNANFDAEYKLQPACGSQYSALLMFTMIPDLFSRILGTRALIARIGPRKFVSIWFWIASILFPHIRNQLPKK